MSYLRDYVAGDIVRFGFNTIAPSTGQPITWASGAMKVQRVGTAGLSSTGVTLTLNQGYAGFHWAAIDTASYPTAGMYAVLADAGTVESVASAGSLIRLFSVGLDQSATKSNVGISSEGKLDAIAAGSATLDGNAPAYPTNGLRGAMLFARGTSTAGFWVPTIVISNTVTGSPARNVLQVEPWPVIPAGGVLDYELIANPQAPQSVVPNVNVTQQLGFPWIRLTGDPAAIMGTAGVGLTALASAPIIAEIQACLQNVKVIKNLDGLTGVIQIFAVGTSQGGTPLRQYPIARANVADDWDIKRET